LSNSVSYVSSEKNKVSQAKLNNVITSLKDFVSCTTNDKTEQDYGVIEYNGAICLGQKIQGTKKPRTQNVPIISNNNVFLGYLDASGTLTVSNNKQIYNPPSQSLCMTGSGFAVVCSSSISECDTKYNLSCTCTINNIVEKNKLTTETCWDIIDCCIICENMQQCVSSILYNGTTCIGNGTTSFYRSGENNECVNACNNIYVYGTHYVWCSPALVQFDGSIQRIVALSDNISFIDSCLSNICSSYSATRSPNKNGLDFEMTLNCKIDNKITYSTTDCVSISERYV